MTNLNNLRENTSLSIKLRIIGTSAITAFYCLEHIAHSHHQLATLFAFIGFSMLVLLTYFSPNERLKNKPIFTRIAIILLFSVLAAGKLYELITLTFPSLNF